MDYGAIRARVGVTTRELEGSLKRRSHPRPHGRYIEPWSPKSSVEEPSAPAWALPGEPWVVIGTIRARVGVTGWPGLQT